MLVYRQALSQGLRPSLKALDRMLACLRLPYIPPLASEGTPSTAPISFKVPPVNPRGAVAMLVAILHVFLF